MVDDVTKGIPPDETASPREETTRFYKEVLRGLIRELLRLVQPTFLSFPPPSSPSIHPPTTSALSAIHVSAFECLNNIFLSKEALPNTVLFADYVPYFWSTTWKTLFKVGLDIAPGQERKREIWEVAVGVLWGIGNILKGELVREIQFHVPRHSHPSQQVPVDEQVQTLMKVCDSSTEARVQVKCIGTLECLAQHPDSIEANRVRCLVRVRRIVRLTSSIGDIHLFIIHLTDCDHSVH